MPPVEELSIDGVPAIPPQQAVVFTPFGTPVTVNEVRNRLGRNLYDQLSEKSGDTVTNAISRAVIYVGAILHYLNIRLDLDVPVIREIVLIQTVYELHIALGHEEAGREYRIQAKNTIVAAFGSFPDSDTAAPERPAVAAVALPPKVQARF
jgi:hypothetical protein